MNKIKIETSPRIDYCGACKKEHGYDCPKDMNENKLLMLKGLPGCGKTTYALKLVAKGWKRVNKDDLRSMIDGGKWSNVNEDGIVETRDLLIIQYLDEGFNVVVDDTNLAPIHEETLSEIADNCDAEFMVKEFNTPVYECIERDAKRGDKSVGSKVILNMYFKYIEKDFQYNDHKESAYIFDIDGTLARMTDRSPYDYSKVSTDKINPSVALICRLLSELKFPIILCSGRKEECRAETESWLLNNGIHYNTLFMRQTGDDRKDAIVKEEIYHNNIEPLYNIIGVFDDRNQVVDMWRSLGLTCFQVNYGGF